MRVVTSTHSSPSLTLFFPCAHFFHLRVNEVLFGACSNDVLFSLTSDEVSQNIEGNRLARLAGHLLQQQSFSPQFPVPQNLLAQVHCCVLFVLALRCVNARTSDYNCVTKFI